jgi:flagellar motor switch protein FliG
MIKVKFVDGGIGKYERAKLVVFDLFKEALPEGEEEWEIEIQVSAFSFNTLLEIIDGVIEDVKIPLLKEMLQILGYLGNCEVEDKICRQIATRASQLSYKELGDELHCRVELSYVLDSG